MSSIDVIVSLTNRQLYYTDLGIFISGPNVPSNSFTLASFSSFTRAITAETSEVGKNDKKSSIFFLVASSPFKTSSSFPDKADCPTCGLRKRKRVRMHL